MTGKKIVAFLKKLLNSIQRQPGLKICCKDKTAKLLNKKLSNPRGEQRRKANNLNKTLYVKYANETNSYT